MQRQLANIRDIINGLLAFKAYFTPSASDHLRESRAGVGTMKPLLALEAFIEADEGEALVPCPADRKSIASELLHWVYRRRRRKEKVL